MLKIIVRYAKHLSALFEHYLRDFGLRERSKDWVFVEKLWLHEHDRCEACGSREHLEVHHKRPFALDHVRELEATNLITLCMTIDRHCHLMIGHGGDFRSYNPHVDGDSMRARQARSMGSARLLAQVEESAKRGRRYELEEDDEPVAA
jgi:hypothetical protein